MANCELYLSRWMDHSIFPKLPMRYTPSQTSDTMSTPTINGINFVISSGEKKPIESSTIEMAPIRKIDQSNHKKKNGAQHYSQQSKTVIRQFNMAGHYVSEYATVKSASIDTGISEKSINNALYGYRKSGGGFIWKRCERTSQIEDVQPITKCENTGIGRPIVQIDMNGRQVAQYPSKRAASIKTGINVRGISDVLSGIQKSAGGFKWQYFGE